MLNRRKDKTVITDNKIYKDVKYEMLNIRDDKDQTIKNMKCDFNTYYIYYKKSAYKFFGFYCLFYIKRVGSGPPIAFY